MLLHKKKRPVDLIHIFCFMRDTLTCLLLYVVTTPASIDAELFLLLYCDQALTGDYITVSNTSAKLNNFSQQNHIYEENKQH